MHKQSFLKKLTRFRLGGPARVICAQKTSDIPGIIQMIKKEKEPFFILGGGTNIIASDKGYGGVIIRIQTHSIAVKKNTIICDTGVLLQKLIDTANAYGLAGLETLAGIPGTVGGAIYGNAGAYGNEIKNVIQNVTIYDGRKTRTLSKKECRFDYRESIFKKKTWVILSALFVFKKGPSISFGPAQDKSLRARKKHLQKISKDIIMLRLKKYKPSMRCAGSIFKNIPVGSSLGKKLIKKIPKGKIIKGKIPAGFLLESVGAKGMRKGGIMVARHHGNLIVNTGKGTACDAKYVIDLLKNKVRREYGITLEEEVRYLGFGKKR